MTKFLINSNNNAFFRRAKLPCLRTDAIGNAATGTWNIANIIKMIGAYMKRMVKKYAFPLKFYKLAIYAAPLSALPAHAYATTEYNKQIAHVGSQTNNLAYVTFTAPPAGGCLYGNLYLNITTDWGKSFFAILLTAYSQGKTITRIDYTNTSGTCTIDIIEF